MYGCESRTVKKAQRQRMDALELWCWRRLLTVPGTARRSNQSILKEMSPEYSLQGLMLKLKLQYFGHLVRRAALRYMDMLQDSVERQTSSSRRNMCKSRLEDLRGGQQPWVWISVDDDEEDCRRG